MDSAGFLESYSQRASAELSGERPLTKYEMLFTGTQGARHYQRTFVEELYLQNRFNFFVGKISDVVNSLDFDSSDGVDLEAITAFSESLKEAEKARYQCKRLPFPTFFKDVYPAYLEAMVTTEDYYLSDIELLALAHCTAQNVAIFVHSLERHQLTYARSYIGKPELPVIATCLLDSHGQGAVRTHFERLS